MGKKFAGKIISGIYGGGQSRILASIMIVLIVVTAANMVLAGGYVQAENLVDDENFLRASGYLQPVDTVDKSAAISGVVDSIKIETGEIAEEGAGLFALEKSQAEKELEAAERSLAREQALLAAEKDSVRQAQTSLRLAEHELLSLQGEEREVLEAEVELAAIDRDYELREFERAERLFQRDAMEEIEFDRYRYNLNRAEQNLKISELTLQNQRQEDEDRIAEAELRVEEAEQALEAAENQLQAARERVAAAEVERDQARLRLGEHVVRSPAEMLVLDKHVETGEYVSPGEPVITLASQELRVLIEPDEREVADIYRGQSGEAIVESYPERPFAVEVSEIAPRVDLDRGTLVVYLEIKEDVPELLPYMTVSVDLELEEE